MNTRFEKLAEQAYDDLVNETGNIVVFDEDFQQRFAELIVKECAALVKGQPHFDKMIDCNSVIKQHFGVEE